MKVQVQVTCVGLLKGLQDLLGDLGFLFSFLLLLLVYHENGSHVWKQEVSPLMQCVANNLSFRINDARNHIQSRKQFSW